MIFQQAIKIYSMTLRSRSPVLKFRIGAVRCVDGMPAAALTRWRAWSTTFALAGQRNTPLPFSRAGRAR